MGYEDMRFVIMNFLRNTSAESNEEPVMIELNLNWCDLNVHQPHHGPLFGESTEEILDSIISKDEQIISIT